MHPFGDGWTGVSLFGSRFCVSLIMITHLCHDSAYQAVSMDLHMPSFSAEPAFKNPVGMNRRQISSEEKGLGESIMYAFDSSIIQIQTPQQNGLHNSPLSDRYDLTIQSGVTTSHVMYALTSPKSPAAPNRKPHEILPINPYILKPGTHETWPQVRGNTKYQILTQPERSEKIRLPHRSSLDGRVKGL